MSTSRALSIARHGTLTVGLGLVLLLSIVLGDHPGRRLRERWTVITRRGGAHDMLGPVGVFSEMAVACFVLSAVFSDHEKRKSLFA
jgi:hypothetical protein